MAITNYTEKEVQFKVVIYGAPFAGKATTLRCIHSRLEAARTGNINTLKSGADTTVFFEFTPRDATLLDDFKIRFDIFTIPGNVVFNAPRKLMLRDADGIIFVANSSWDQMAANAQSLKNLEENLKKQGIDLDGFPMVLQYNKRDLPDAAPTGYLDFVLNNRKLRCRTFETVAADGKNVLAPLRSLTQMLVQHFFATNRSQPLGAHLGIMAGE